MTRIERWINAALPWALAALILSFMVDFAIELWSMPW